MLKNIQNAGYVEKNSFAIVSVSKLGHLSALDSRMTPGLSRLPDEASIEGRVVGLSVGSRRARRQEVFSPADGPIGDQDFDAVNVLIQQEGHQPIALGILVKNEVHRQGVILAEPHGKHPLSVERTLALFGRQGAGSDAASQQTAIEVEVAVEEPNWLSLELLSALANADLSEPVSIEPRFAEGMTGPVGFDVFQAGKRVLPDLEVFAARLASGERVMMGEGAPVFHPPINPATELYGDPLLTYPDGVVLGWQLAQKLQESLERSRAQQYERPRGA